MGDPVASSPQCPPPPAGPQDIVTRQGRLGRPGRPSCPVPPGLSTIHAPPGKRLPSSEKGARARPWEGWCLDQTSFPQMGLCKAGLLKATWVRSHSAPLADGLPGTLGHSGRSLRLVSLSSSGCSGVWAVGARVAWAGVAPSPLFHDLGWATKGTSPGTVVRVWEKPSQGEAAGEGFVPTSKRADPPVPVGHQPGAALKRGTFTGTSSGPATWVKRP